jgi:hypothetical protein
MQSVWKAVKPTNQRNGSLHVKQMQGSKVWGIPSNKALLIEIINPSMFLKFWL